MRWLVHDFWWKLGSLVLAAVVWGVVSAEPEIETVMTVPVQYANRNSALEVGSDYLQSIRLELRGSSGRLRDLNNAKNAVVLDFSGVHDAGERTFPITWANAGLPRGVELVRAVPSELHFVFEKSARKTVPVQVRTSGVMNRGSVAGAVAIPANVLVAGPESRVNRVHFVLTDPVDLSTIARNSVRTTAIYVTEPEVRLVSPPHVQVKVSLKQ